MITTRDLAVVDFVKTFKAARTETIAKLFYPSLTVAQIRLKQLADENELNRYRDSATHEYIYFKAKPRQLRHDLLLTDFYAALSGVAKVSHFKKEYTIGNVRADGFCGYSVGGKNYIAFVEIQIAHSPVDIGKYERLYQSHECQRQFGTFPRIIAVSNSTIPESPLKVIPISEALTEIKRACS